MSLTVPFDVQCAAAGLPVPTPEYRFAPPRKWMFDWAWPGSLVAVEQEGGVWKRGGGGRHNQGQGFLDDMTKYNAAALAGWRVFRFTPEQVADGSALKLVETALRRVGGETLPLFPEA